MTQNQTSFRRGISGNPGGRPATAEVSALARRYTADWLRALIGVVRLPVCKENAPSIISAAIALRDTGYPGLTKSQEWAGAHDHLHLHLLAVSKGEYAFVGGFTEAPSGRLIKGVSEADLQADQADWAEIAEAETHEPILDDAYIPPVDERMPHEALPLWDAAAGAGNDENQAIGPAEGETDDAERSD